MARRRIFLNGVGAVLCSPVRNGIYHDFFHCPVPNPRGSVIRCQLEDGLGGVAPRNPRKLPLLGKTLSQDVARETNCLFFKEIRKCLLAIGMQSYRVDVRAGTPRYANRAHVAVAKG